MNTPAGVGGGEAGGIKGYGQTQAQYTICDAEPPNG
jgi:hypothetical protein